VNNREKISLLGQNMGESLDTLVRTELNNGTARIAGGATLSSIAASNVLSASEIRQSVRALEANKAMAYDDGMFIGKAQPYTKADLLNDSTWINSKVYSDVQKLYKGEMGSLYQVRWLLSTNGYSTVGAAGTSSSAVAVYHNYIHGKEAFGCYDLSGDAPKLFIVPNQVDSANPAGRFSLASWAGSYTTKLLNSNWVIVLKTGATQ
jgi:N4-gp56 family major capsid protein